MAGLAGMPPCDAGLRQSRDFYAILDTDPEEQFDRLAKLASLTLRMPIAAVSLLDTNRQWFKAMVGTPLKETPLEYSFSSYAVREDELFVVSDASQDSRFCANPLVTGEPGIRFYAGVPLHIPGGPAIGTLSVIDRVPRTLDDRERNVLQELGSMVVREMELRRAAMTDSLTGVFNRRTLDMLVDKELARLRRTRQIFSLAVFDLDHFKNVNDTLGHEAGDRVLVAFARLASQCFRRQDLLFRTGGEEFAILLVGTRELAAEVPLERFRNLLQQTVVETPAGPVRVTASIGAAEATADDVAAGDLASRADEALYQAKRAGRNRTVLHSMLGRESPR